MVERGQISLRGLPDLIVAELLLGLQLRSATGTKTPLRTLRFFTYRLRVRQVASIVDLDGIDHEQNVASLWRSLIGHLRRAASTPEDERRKDIWDATIFGHRGTINFTGIRQRWMRESLKEWAFEELPTHRGKGAAAVVASKVKAIRFLSDSLHLQRADHGETPGLLTRIDIASFLNYMAYLETSGTVSRSWRVRLTRDTARILNDLRALGLTQPGRSAAGMPEDFTLRRGDIPQEADDDSPGRALPDPALRHLYSALPILEDRSSREIRVATELLMDTGRRPDEILNLPLDCLDRDRDGKYVLIYEDFKLHRKNRRLPITDGTASVIEAQRTAVIARYPKADRSTLPLLPSRLRNPRGQRPLPQASFGAAHRTWIHALLPIELPSGIVIDKPDDLVPYAYRHSYAQRHADAGVPLDVCEISWDTTQLPPPRSTTESPRNGLARPSTESARSNSTGTATGSGVRPRPCSTTNAHACRSARSPFPTASAPNRPTFKPAGTTARSGSDASAAAISAPTPPISRTCGPICKTCCGTANASWPQANWINGPAPRRSRPKRKSRRFANSSVASNTTSTSCPPRNATRSTTPSRSSARLAAP
ncbi:hypothetical protein [Nocardia sp. NPDC059154]|uniref:hypothetical protein n=1 Tax=Nocardia sp. NPDC059154 TaxID=3346744 RepID=UPI003685F83B